MPQETYRRLKDHLNSNQPHREQMCLAILSLDKNYSNIKPLHPYGGRDGGKDIKAIYKDEYEAYAAVGFINDANDSKEQRKQISDKFKSDLNEATKANKGLKCFVFFTNIRFTESQKSTLIQSANRLGLINCEIYDRELIRIALDSPDGLAARYQYLGITLSPEEQQNFFSRWGDDIQSVISTRFQKMEQSIKRMLFLQEAQSETFSMFIKINLDREYTSAEIGHFRIFCDLYLSHNDYAIESIQVGMTDKEWDNNDKLIRRGTNTSGWYENGISSITSLFFNSEDKEKYEILSNGSSIGNETVASFVLAINIWEPLIKLHYRLKLSNLDESHYIFTMNKSVAQKISNIEVYASGYLIAKHDRSVIKIRNLVGANKAPELVDFTEKELRDEWVFVNPDGSSMFRVNFGEITPKRYYEPSEID